MILIASAAYLGPEFVAEFGLLPPAFLPVGNRRLFEHQIASVSAIPDRLYISLPLEFILSESDQEILANSNVSVIHVPPGLSLADSIVYCVNLARSQGEPLRLLLGDTLIDNLGEFELDVALSADTQEYYRWAECKTLADGRYCFIEGLTSGSTPRRVLCGYFAFSDTMLLVQSATLARGNFIDALNKYHDSIPLRLINTSNWSDFGHIQTYYQSKARVSTARSFNDVLAARGVIIKQSFDVEKILAEANWFEAMPIAVQLFTPRYLGQRVIGTGEAAYELEHLYLSTLAELWVFGELPDYTWVQILSKAADFMSLLGSLTITPGGPLPNETIYLDKTIERLERFSVESGSDLRQSTTLNGKLLPSLSEIATVVCRELAPPVGGLETLWHGDFCFSNIFYDFRAQLLRTIDPRGRGFNGEASIFGDPRYDLAKLSHSLIGGYDFILANRYRVNRYSAMHFDFELPAGQGRGELIEAICDLNFGGYRITDDFVIPMTISLFLSMLPLHSDDIPRQDALTANALRLFADWYN